MDDGGQDVGQFGADDQQPFGVGLGRGDLHQRDQLGAGRRGVLDEAVVAELGQFLDPDPGVPQRFDRCPGPERPVFFPGQVAACPGRRVLGPDLGPGPCSGRGAVQDLAAVAERLAVADGLGGGQPLRGGAGLGLDAGHQGGQRGQALPGPLVDPGLAATQLLGPAQVLPADRARGRPRSPPGGFFHRPLGDVQVEGADLAELGPPVGPRQPGLDGLSVGVDAVGGLDQDALFPGRGHLRCQVQRADPGMV